MNIHICSLREFYSLVDQPDFDRGRAAAIISTSGSVQVARLQGIRYTGAIYDDIGKDAFGRLFSPENADKFARFIRNLDEKSIHDLYCVCDGGMRRSAAVACAAKIFYGQDDLPVWYDAKNFEPNCWVFRMLCRSMNLPITEIDVDLRGEINRQALRDLIRKSRLPEEG